MNRLRLRGLHRITPVQSLHIAWVISIGSPSWFKTNIYNILTKPLDVTVLCPLVSLVPAHFCGWTLDVPWIILPISLLRFWTWEHFSCVAVYGGSESSQIQTKTSSFVFRRWTKFLLMLFFFTLNIQLELCSTHDLNSVSKVSGSLLHGALDISWWVSTQDKLKTASALTSIVCANSSHKCSVSMEKPLCNSVSCTSDWLRRVSLITSHLFLCTQPAVSFFLNTHTHLWIYGWQIYAFAYSLFGVWICGSPTHLSDMFLSSSTAASMCVVCVWVVTTVYFMVCPLLSRNCSSISLYPQICNTLCLVCWSKLR